MIKYRFLSIHFFGCIGLCFLSVIAFGQYKIRDDGRLLELGSRTVNSIQQDADGFLWIGTRKGLFRYDGYELKPYDYNTSQLVGEDVMALLFDSSGRLWAGTVDGGLNLYDLEQDVFKYYNYTNESGGGIESGDVRALHEDRHGNIWVATKHGLNKYLPEEDRFEVYSQGFENYLIRDLTSDNYGNIWCGTFGGGLFKLEAATGKISQYAGSGGMKNIKVQAILRESDECLLVGTRDHGLLRFYLSSGQFSTFFASDSPYSSIRSVVALEIDREKGELWVGTDGDGMITLKRTHQGWQEYDLYSGFNGKELANGIYSIFKDTEQNIWVGSAWQGLYVLERMINPVDFYEHLVDNKSVSVWSVFRSGDEIWLGTDGHGLYIQEIEGEQKVLKQLFDGIKITSISKREDGLFWLGTYSHGLILFDGRKEIKRYQFSADQNTLSSNDIRDVVETSSGFWVATWSGGLNYLDKKKSDITVLQNELGNRETLSNNNITDLAWAANGLLWVGTFGGGVNLLNPDTKKLEEIRRAEGSELLSLRFRSKNITCLMDDGKGTLWAGMWMNGVQNINLRSGKVTSFDQFADLADQTVTGLHSDSHGNVWIGTETTVYQYHAAKDTIIAYKDLEGSYHFGASYKDSDGKLFFGGMRGVAAFTPEKMIQDQRSLSVKLMDFSLFNESVRPDQNAPLRKHVLVADQVVLEYDQRVATFSFGVVDLPFSEDCRYLIKMEPFDDHWRDNGMSRSATYTNLSPGHYSFRVRAIESNGVASGETAIAVWVKKPFWITWWAFLIYTVIFAVLLYLFRKYSIYWEKMKSQLRLEQLSREKEAELHEVKLRFFTNISHEIRTPVTLILSSLNRLVDRGITDHSQLKAIEVMKKNGDHLYNLVTELLDFRKLESGEARLRAAEGDIIRFTREIFLSFNDFAASKGIDYRFEGANDRPSMIWYDRDEMEKVLYNLISNAFKHTPPEGRIVVSVSDETSGVSITIADTGRGIAKGQLERIFHRFYQSDSSTGATVEGSGLGLAIVHDIVDLHGGEIIARSTLGRGSSFIVRLKKGADHLPDHFKLPDFKDSEDISLYQHVSEDQSLAGSDLLSTSDFSELTILIAEDNTEIRSYLHDLLKEHFSVLLAEDGAEALEITYREIPDLVITDVMMPRMDGITYASKIKNDPRTSHIPIIALTARTSLIYKKEGLDTGVDDYVTKPFSDVLLKSRIRNLLLNRARLKEKFSADVLSEPAALAVRSPDQEFLKNLAKVIEDNMGEEDLTADFICREMSMSQSNIYKKLKALTGMSIVEFVRDFRLKYAAQLMVNQRLSVSEACFRVGYNDRRYFSQMFKTKYGVTPTRFVTDKLG